jgi:hypothetical protein
LAAGGASDRHVVTAIVDAAVDFDSPAAWDAHMVVIKRCLDAPGTHARRRPMTFPLRT